jgi:hypothetical protein
VPGNGLLDAALDARRRGWSVIPVGGDKKPVFGWKQYQVRLPAEGLAVLDLETLAALR